MRVKFGVGPHVYTFSGAHSTSHNPNQTNTFVFWGEKRTPSSSSTRGTRSRRWGNSTRTSTRPTTRTTTWTCGMMYIHMYICVYLLIYSGGGVIGSIIHRFTCACACMCAYTNFYIYLSHHPHPHIHSHPPTLITPGTTARRSARTWRVSPRPSSTTGR